VETYLEGKRGPPLQPMRLSCLATSHSPTHLTFHFLQPKSSRPHWLIFLIELSFPWMFDTCQRSKRGLLSLSCYLRDLSLPHYSPFFTVLLCYQILSISLSLSLIIVILLHWFWFLKSLEQLCCYNLFPLDNKEIALEELWRSRFVWMCHLFMR
jgi:hypothetical protein